MPVAANLQQRSNGVINKNGESDLVDYRNTELGFDFQYPKQWGPVNYGEASTTASTLMDVRRLVKPDSGNIFIGNFALNSRCGFGGISEDYSYGAEFPLFVSAGWIANQGNYFSRWKGMQNVSSVKLNTRLLPTHIVSIASGTAQALIFELSQKDYGGDDSSLGFDTVSADLNLQGPIFHGVEIGCQGTYNDHPSVASSDRMGLYVILSTFRRIPD